MATKTLTSLTKLTCTNRFINAFIKRQNHSQPNFLEPDLEVAFNNQINLEFFASYTYLAMAAFFDRQNVAYPGFHKYFMNQVFDEREHAHKFIEFVNKRGGSVTLQPIQGPANQTWESPLAAFKDALLLEKCVSEKIFQLHKTAQDFGDLYSCNLLESDFLDNQIEETNKLTRHVAQLEKIGNDGAGIYLFDRYLFKDSSQST